MSPDRHPDPSPLDALAHWIRAQGSDDAVAALTDDRMRELTDRALAEGRRRRTSRRRRRLAAGLGVGVLAAGSAVAAAVALRSEPTAPEIGIVCRAEAALDASAIVIEPGSDPIAACRARWDAGDFEDAGTSDEPRDLVACIGRPGGIEVFPGDAGTCEQLGLDQADTTPSADNGARLDLQDRLIADINEIDCLSAAEAEAEARRILAELGLDEWTVRVNDDAVGADCAKAGIETGATTVFIHRL